ncbi:MAG: FAD-binding protein [Chloroflexi bacterium]|nr:FAD-binding protein [Chloroflexota bacterium]
MDLLAALGAAVPDGVVSDPDALERYRSDEAALLHPPPPRAAVRPRTTAEVSAVLRIASAQRIPVVPRGAGSGLAGGANAVDGCIVLSLERMNRIVEVNPVDMVARVEPGVVNAELKAATAEHGLAYPPDPASYERSTIGGNLATNAGGLCCVKYGVTRDYVLGLEAVLPDGEIVRTGRRTVKGVAGYDLTALLVGSEGTLAVITEATLRLRPLPPPGRALVASFATLRTAGQAVTAVRSTLVPALLELLDRNTLRAIETMQPLGLDPDAAALLVIRSDAPGEVADQELRLIEERCTAAGATLVVRGESEAESEMLMRARRLAGVALRRNGTVLAEDVAVPCSLVPELIDAIERVAERQGVTIATFGHAGDGNMHPAILFDRSDPASERAARAAFDDIMAAALALGGTVTGEHGVGLLKREALIDELGPSSLALHRRIKSLFDPLGIMNPGKVLL